MAGRRGTRSFEKCHTPHPDHPEWLCDRRNDHDEEHRTHPYDEVHRVKVEYGWPGDGPKFIPGLTLTGIERQAVMLAKRHADINYNLKVRS